MYASLRYVNILFELALAVITVIIGDFVLVYEQ